MKTTRQKQIEASIKSMKDGIKKEDEVYLNLEGEITKVGIMEFKFGACDAIGEGKLHWCDCKGVKDVIEERFEYLEQHVFDMTVDDLEVELSEDEEFVLIKLEEFELLRFKNA